MTIPSSVFCRACHMSAFPFGSSLTIHLESPTTSRSWTSTGTGARSRPIRHSGLLKAARSGCPLLARREIRVQQHRLCSARQHRGEGIRSRFRGIQPPSHLCPEWRRVSASPRHERHRVQLARRSAKREGGPETHVRTALQVQLSTTRPEGPQ